MSTRGMLVRLVTTLLDKGYRLPVAAMHHTP